MADYGSSKWYAEWSKWLCYQLGKKIGLPTPSGAALVGCICLLFAAWLPGQAVKLLSDLPGIVSELGKLGVTMRVLRIANWVAFGIAIAGFVCCWCRVACICYPNIFDRHKIKGIPF